MFSHLPPLKSKLRVTAEAEDVVMTNKHILVRISVLVAMMICFAAVSRAQSVLTDDANTVNSPKDADSNFGTNPNPNVAANSNIYLKFKPSQAP